MNVVTSEWDRKHQLYPILGLLLCMYQIHASFSPTQKYNVKSTSSSLNEYRKHRRVSRTFLHKIVSNRGFGLSARTSVHHAVNLHKLTLFSENFTICIDLHCTCSKMIRTS